MVLSAMPMPGEEAVGPHWAELPSEGGDAAGALGEGRLPASGETTPTPGGPSPARALSHQEGASPAPDIQRRLSWPPHPSGLGLQMEVSALCRRAAQPDCFQGRRMAPEFLTGLHILRWS